MEKKTFDKNLKPFMIKAVEKLEIEGSCLKMIKAI
jgi:hypothetical protein